MRPSCLFVTAILIGPATTVAQSASDSAFSVPIEVVSQGTTMRAMLHVAAGPGPHATLVSFKGFPGSNSQAFAKFLQSRGFNAITPNFRGQQDSDGTYDVAGTAADATAIVNFLRADSARRAFRIDQQRIAISGTSAGSFGALSAAAADGSIRCAALIVPFNWTTSLLELRKNSVARTAMVAQLQQMTSSNPPPVRLDSGFVNRAFEAAETVDLRDVAKRLFGRQVLMIGAQRDATAPIVTHFEPVRDALRAGQAIVRDTILDDTHNLPASAQVVYDLMATWLGACTR